MQTIYYTTHNFIRHRSNVVDLGEYRRRLDLAQSSSLAPDYRQEAPAPEVTPLRLVEAGEKPLSKQERRSARRARQAWALDVCASLAVLAMTTAFTLTALLG